MQNQQNLSLAQQGIYFDQLRLPNNPCYNIGGVIKIRGPLDSELLCKALQVSTDFFDMLRTDFVTTGNDIHQIFNTSTTLHIETVSVQNDANPASAAAEAIRLLFNTPFSIGEEKLHDIKLFRLSDTEYWWFNKFHHLIGDAFGMLFYVQTVSKIYTDLKNDIEPSFDMAFGKYSDQHDQDLRYLESDKYIKDAKYWNKIFATLPAQFLSPKKKKDNEAPLSSRRVSFTISDEFKESLKDLTKATGSGLQHIGLAAIALYFSKNHEQSDLILGVVVHRRRTKSQRNMLGMMSSDLPCRLQVDQSDSLFTHIKNISTELRESYRHQAYPSNHLSRDLELSKQGRQQLVDINFNYEPFDPQLDFSGIRGHLSPIVSDYSRDILQVRICDYVGQDLQLHIDYRLDYFDDKEGKLIANRIFHTLKEMSTVNINTRLEDIDLVPNSEKQLLLEWNDTRTSFENTQCIQTAFEHAVEKYPNEIAIICEERQLSYDALNKESNKLAHLLREEGVTANSLVGICIDRDIEMVVGMMAILKSGGAFVPLDPVNPLDRIDYMLGDSRINILLTNSKCNSKYYSLLSKHRVKALILDERQSKWQNYSIGNPELLTNCRHWAYMMYTSGSTGKPKGALLNHQGTLNHIWGELDLMDLNQPFNFLQSASTSSDVSVWQVLSPLLVGGSTIILNNMADAPQLFAVIKKHKVDLIELVPAILRIYVDYLYTLEQVDRSLPDLKWLMMVAEACPVGLINEWLALYPDVPVMNGYGPTEASDDICYYLINKPLSCDSVPIGKPLPNLNIHILDKRHKLLPIGVPGEICVSGIGVGDGYWKNPDKTKEAFIANPFKDSLGDVIYRTGDIGKWMPNGELEFIGRQDNQIKVRGFRVELGEIEAIIGAMDPVAQVCVMAQKSVSDQYHLICYVVPTGKYDVETEIIDNLSTSLPDYMHPHRYVIMDKFPLNVADKIDRKALPKVVITTVRQTTIKAPRSDLQSKLCEIWQELLDMNVIGIDENFFMLGGHSLLAGNLIVKVKETLGHTIRLSALFENPTIQAMSTHIENNRDVQKSELTINKIKPEPEHDNEPFPLTQIQQAYWIGRNNVYELGNVATHDYIEFDFVNFNLDRFQSAFNRLIEHHGMLRMVVHDDATQQILKDVPEYHFKQYDVSLLEELAQSEHLTNIRNEMHHQVLPADTWPQFDIRASCIGNKAYRIHLSIDALISDAWSGGIIQQQLSALYKDPTSVLPSMELTFRDYVIADEELKTQDIYQQSKQYWLERLADFPSSPDLPLAVSPSTIKNPHFSRICSTLSPDKWNRIKQYSASLSLTPSAVLMTAYGTILAQWCKEKRFILNLTLFNRLPLHPQVNELVGDFTSLNLLEIDHTEPHDFAFRSQALQKQLLKDLENRHFSGIDVIRELNRQSDHSKGISMPIVFTSTLGSNTEKQDTDQVFSLSNATFQTSQTPQVWLDHIVEEINGELLLSWEAVDELFPKNVLDDMFSSYVKLLEKLSDDHSFWTATQYTSLPREQGERRASYNETKNLTYNTGLIHQDFRNQVTLTPDRIAVSTQHETFTYQQTFNIANDMAHSLVKKGAKPNKLVAIVLDKSWQQIPAVLAVLLSGAAYMPIDPKLPKDRIIKLLKQGEVDLVLSHQTIIDNFPWPYNINCIAVEKQNQNTLFPALPILQRESDIAYVIFTSGSTGAPKGVLIDHLGASNTIADINQRFLANKNDCVLALSSLSFDLSVYDIFGPLSVGGKIVIPDANLQNDPAHWWDLVKQERISIWNTVPALIQIFTDFLENNSFLLPKYFRLVMMSGDWVPAALPSRVQKLSKENLAIISLGGATEASIWSIAYPILETDHARKTIPYGYALSNQTMHILDCHHNPCPEHVIGEIFIGGVGLAKAYWKDHVKTDAAFVYCHQTNERLYKTGDLGRFSQENGIEFIGRLDQQVKINGYRIELGEIETTLILHDSIKTAVVAVKIDSLKRKQLIAYYIPEEPATGDVEESILSLLSKSLPEYMIPKRAISVSKIPLNANGKVNRDLLPTPQMRSETTVFDSSLLPRSKLQKLITECWESVFQTKSVSIQDNFFNMGGDSIMIIQVLGRIRNKGISVKLEQMYANQTIASLSKSIESTHRSNSLIEPGDTNPQWALSPMQHWFFNTFKIAEGHANLSIVLDIITPLDLVVLRTAFCRVVSNHPMLSSRYVKDSSGEWSYTTNRQPNQAANTLATHSIAGSITQQQEQRSERIKELQNSFSLEEGKLCGLMYFQYSDDNRPDQLVISGHLLALDGVSLRILIDDLFSTYEDTLNNMDANIPQPFSTNSYQNWVGAIMQTMQKENWQEQTQYWQTTLKDVEPNLPVNNTSIADSFADLQTYDGTLDDIDTYNILNLQNQLNVSINEILLYALGEAYRDLAKSSDLLIDFEVHGRMPQLNGVDITRTIGWFTSMYPVLVRTSTDQNALQKLQSIKSCLFDVPLQGAAFGPLLYLHPDQNVRQLMEALPKPQISFNHLGHLDQFDTQYFNVSDEVINDMNDSGQIRPHHLDISTRIVGHKLYLHIRYNRQLNTQLEISRFTTKFLSTLITLSAEHSLMSFSEGVG